ncbi:hypothetical protein CROQUDRAFT_101362 [Cronartium quercuum f. sp. fusiforme G11]|uniref:Uncharacterized protein n=1 Tax=Cronartium quercuum f. sp. fusiforme G11 TaxID=708437 RepID=A0A9P6T6M2_9BASI|nr:hypothetical protein CROQUDRAFT_101362 [Cronartium quercuum f. sp. fusiforme G11]
MITTFLYSKCFLKKIYLSKPTPRNPLLLRTTTDWEFYYINEQLFKKKVALKWLPGTEQLADTFTKQIGPLKFKDTQRQLGVM